MFLYRRANYLSEQRFCQQTRFGMICRGGSNWTAVTVDKMFSIFFAKTCCAAQVPKNAECSINSLLTRFTLQAAQMFLSHFSAGNTHSGAQIPGLHLTREYRHEKRDQSPVGFGKDLFRFRAESIRGVGFANARPEAGLRHEPVSLKTGKVCSHSVISQVQFVRELVHRAFSSAQKVEDFAPGAFEQPLPPAYMFHYIKDHGGSD